MIKKKWGFIVLLSLLVVPSLEAFELGIIAGKNSEPSHTVYGISAGLGFLPLLKIEAEWVKIKDTESKVLTLGLSLRKKFGPLAPFAAAGFGTEYDSFSIGLKDHANFSYIGGGVHWYLAPIFSVRGDLRFHHYKAFNRTRFSLGAFIHF